MLDTILQYILPHRVIALIARLCAECSVPWIKNYLINYFIKRYPVKMHEAVQSDPFAYATYNDFFTRRLKPEARPLAMGYDVLTSPADGVIAQIGLIKGYELLQAKGHYYSVLGLLGGDQSLAQKFKNGSFATVYLAPKDYHRVHMPCAGTLRNMMYIPGKLFSVNEHAANNIPGLFARNERVVSIFDTEFGTVAVILVGAMIVGGIATTWEGVITPPHRYKMFSKAYAEQHVTLAKGAEMGLFKLGSTVIVLCEQNKVTWDIVSGMAVQMGQAIGKVSQIKHA